MPVTDGKSPMIFQGIIRACEACSDNLVRLAARTRAYRHVKKESAEQLELLSRELESLASSGFELDENEGSVDFEKEGWESHLAEWSTAEFINKANYFASRTCRHFQAAFSLSDCLAKWPELHLAVVEELYCFDSNSFGIIASFLDERSIEVRQNLREFNEEMLNDPDIASEFSKIQLPDSPEHAAVVTAKDEQRAFSYSLATQKRPLLTWEQIRITSTRKFPDTPGTVNGVIKGIREWCDRQVPPMQYPPRRKEKNK